MGPILGALASAALGGLWSSLSTVFQNKYNSPVGQLKRLRKAGLPLSYMYQGKVNTQSSAPQLSIDPTLGVVQKQKIDIDREVADANIQKVVAETEEQNLINQSLKGKIDWEMLRDEMGISNQVSVLELQKAKLEADRFISEHTRELKQVAVWVENNLFAEGIQIKERKEALNKVVQQITNLVSQNKLIGQLFDIRSLEALINRTLMDNLNDESDFNIGLYSLLMQLFTKIKI